MTLLLALFACTAGKEPLPLGGNDSAGEPHDSGAPQYYFYDGTTQGQTPDGSYVENPREILFIRVLNPGESTLTEYAWEVDSRGGLSAYDLLHEVDVAAGTFHATFPTTAGTLDVVGAYDEGQPWAWTAWHSTSTYTDGQYLGTRVESTDSIDQAGAVTAHKSVYDPQEGETWQITERLTLVAQVAFEARLDELGGQSPL